MLSNELQELAKLQAVLIAQWCYLPTWAIGVKMSCSFEGKLKRNYWMCWVLNGMYSQIPVAFHSCRMLAWCMVRKKSESMILSHTSYPLGLVWENAGHSSIFLRKRKSLFIWPFSWGVYLRLCFLPFRPVTWSLDSTVCFFNDFFEEVEKKKVKILASPSEITLSVGLCLQRASGARRSGPRKSSLKFDTSNGGDFLRVSPFEVSKLAEQLATYVADLKRLNNFLGYPWPK